MKNKKAGIYIAPNRHRPWDHELRVAETLAKAGHYIEFLPEGLLPCADILLDDIECEIKSPETSKLSSVEQLIRKALKQSSNVIIDGSRRKIREEKLRNYLIYKCRKQRQIKHMLFVTKTQKIIDIVDLI